MLPEPGVLAEITSDRDCQRNLLTILDTLWDAGHPLTRARLQLALGASESATRRLLERLTSAQLVREFANGKRRMVEALYHPTPIDEPLPVKRRRGARSRATSRKRSGSTP
jgi:hypothetical protein